MQFFTGVKPYSHSLVAHIDYGTLLQGAGALFKEIMSLALCGNSWFSSLFFHFFLFGGWKHILELSVFFASSPARGVVQGHGAPISLKAGVRKSSAGERFPQ